MRDRDPLSALISARAYCDHTANPPSCLARSLTLDGDAGHPRRSLLAGAEAVRGTRDPTSGFVARAVGNCDPAAGTTWIETAEACITADTALEHLDTEPTVLTAGVTAGTTFIQTAVACIAAAAARYGFFSRAGGGGGGDDARRDTGDIAAPVTADFSGFEDVAPNDADSPVPAANGDAKSTGIKVADPVVAKHPAVVVAKKPLFFPSAQTSAPAVGRAGEIHVEKTVLVTTQAHYDEAGQPAQAHSVAPDRSARTQSRSVYAAPDRSHQLHGETGSAGEPRVDAALMHLDDAVAGVKETAKEREAREKKRKLAREELESQNAVKTAEKARNPGARKAEQEARMTKGKKNDTSKQCCYIQ